MRKRSLCLLLVVVYLAQLSVLTFALDIFLLENHVNYSWSTGKTQDQCNNAYAYLSTIMDTRYTEKIYDLIYRAQYRLTLFGGESWAYLNTGTDTTLVEDSVLGNISIYASRGCNSYARYAAKYVRGSQGTLKRASDYLGKPQNYVPNASEIKRFVERYADVGERILTGYYNSSRKEPRPHSLVYLGEDPEKDGFYFLCQDGDGNGQTMRYFSYDYMATRLRYYADYGYALAIGDTNSGKDSVPDDKLFGAVDDSIPDNLSFSQDNGFTTTITGWALSKTNSLVRVCAYADGIYLAQADAVTNTKIRSIFPTWDTTGKSGFSLALDVSFLSTGKHVLDIFAEDGSERVLLKSVNIHVNNVRSLAYALEAPNPAETVVLSADGCKTVSVQGWCFDRSGKRITCCYALDGGTCIPLTPQKRDDVFAMPDCAYPDAGFSFTLDYENMAPGMHTVRIFARCASEDIGIAAFSVDVVSTPAIPKDPIRLQIAKLPDRLEYGFCEPLSLDGMILEIVYDDLSTDVLESGYSVSASTDIPGDRTVVLRYAGLAADFSIFVRSPIAPQAITLTAERNTLAPAQTMQITASVTPTDAQAYTVIWESSDPAVASVNSDGSVTGVARGKCEIVAVVYDYYENEICRESTSIKVQSAFRVFWIRIWQWFLRLFGLRNRAAMFEE